MDKYKKQSLSSFVAFIDILEPQGGKGLEDDVITSGNGVNTFVYDQRFE